MATFICNRATRIRVPGAGLIHFENRRFVTEEPAVADFLRGYGMKEGISIHEVKEDGEEPDGDSAAGKEDEEGGELELPARRRGRRPKFIQPA